MRESKFLILVTVSIFLLFLIGCATTPPPKLSEPIKKSETFEVSYKAAWESVIQAITASGEFINVAQKESGLVSFQKSIPINELEDYALVPKGMIWDRAHANVSVLVKEKDKNRTKVTLNTKIIGIGRNQGEVFWRGALARTQHIEMGSKGKIEKEYLHKIASLIPGEKEYEWLEEKKSEKREETDESNIK